jgi:5'-nucleotidase/UDP-sugar diphosphatase
LSGNGEITEGDIPMKKILLIATVLALQPASGAGQSAEEKNDQPGWNVPIGQTEVNLVRSPKGESTMNNLVGDIMLWRTSTDFAFINYGDIHADFEAGPITDVDLYRLIPFDRTLVIIEVTGEFLQKLVEYNISGVRQGMVIAGGKVECDEARPNLHRLNYFQVGEYPCYPLKDYRIVTTDYLAAGNAGFAMLSGIEPVRVFRTGILLRDAVREYIKLNSPLTTDKIKLDGRWERRLAPADE